MVYNSAERHLQHILTASVSMSYNSYHISITRMKVKSEHIVFNPRGFYKIDFKRDW